MFKSHASRIVRAHFGMFSTSHFAPTALRGPNCPFLVQKFYVTHAGPQPTSFGQKHNVTTRWIQLTSFWSKNVTPGTGGSKWPPLGPKRYVTNRRIQLTPFWSKKFMSKTRGYNWPPFGPKTLRHKQADPTDPILVQNITSQTGGSNWPLLVQKLYVKNKRIQLTSF